MKKWLLILLACAGLAQASVRRPCVNATLTEFLKGGYQRTENLAYDAEKGLKGDLYRPEGEGSFPVVLFIHGGGWVGGAKGMLNAVALGEFLACRGYALFDIDYQLAPKVTIAEQVREAKCALAYLKSEGAKLGLDPEKVAVTGGSAGGHLAAMVAFADDPALTPHCASFQGGRLPVSAAILWYGVYDFSKLQAEMGATGVFKNLFGHEPTAAELKLLSPLTYLKKGGGIPTFIIQGEKDGLVPLEQPLALLEKMTALNLPVEAYFVADANHAFDAGVADPRTKKAFQAMLDFLHRVVP